MVAANAVSLVICTGAGDKMFWCRRRWADAKNPIAPRILRQRSAFSGRQALLG
jgi:hypothetical protein